jgi:hypothetical protein
MTEAKNGAVPRESLRILIPLSGANGDVSALRLAAEMAPRGALLTGRPARCWSRSLASRSGSRRSERNRRR